MPNNTAERLQIRPIVAILRGVVASEVVDVGTALLSAGIKAFEIPLNSPNAFESIQRAVDAFSEAASIGAGTVLNVDQVSAIAEAGAEFVVSPNTDVNVIRKSVDLGLLPMPGAATPTEVFTAISSGAHQIKVFPAASLGPTWFNAIKAVIPAEIDLFAVGGVNAENLHQFIQSGAAGIGTGGSVFMPGYSPKQVKKAGVEIVAALEQAMKHFEAPAGV